jgi:tetratricopeptide (TPR) repeat protein
MKRPGAVAVLFAAALASACSRNDAAQVAADGPPDHDAAIALMEKRAAADPRDFLSPTTVAEMRLMRAGIDGDVAEFRRAESAARTALEREPSHLAARAALARALAGEGRTDEARPIVADILEREPRNVGALEAAFDVAFAKGDDRAARAYADRLLAINEEPGTLMRLGRLAERRGDAAGAAALYRRAIRGAQDLGGMPAEIDAYRRLETRAAAAAKAPPR